MSEQTCGNCRFYQQFYGWDDCGACRRYPPTVTHQDDLAVPPMVRADNWCGEWQTTCTCVVGPIDSAITLPLPTYTNPTCPLHGREETNDDKQDASLHDRV